MKMEISTLTKDDIGGFYPVFTTAMKTVFLCYGKKVIDFFLEKVYTPTNFFYWINNQYKTIIVAKKNLEIIGFIVIDQSYGGVSFCRWLAVFSQYQKQGVGRRLINAWEELAKTQGCHKIELASQPLAKKFYEKVGLTLEGKRRLSYFGIDQFIFGKVIGKPKEENLIKYY